MDEWEIIHRYTRAQAIADGTLVDVTPIASERGFTVPVALTRAAWEDCVAWTDADIERTGCALDETGRLWDVLTMAYLAARHSKGTNRNRVGIMFVRVPRDTQVCTATVAELDVHIGPGDDVEPVVTILQPHED